jgi:hypothetical protein
MTAYHKGHFLALIGQQTGEAGRATKYDPEHCMTVRKLAQDGEFPEAWAAEIGASLETMRRWAIAHEEFREAVQIAHVLLITFWTRDIARNRKNPDAKVGLYALIARRFNALYGKAPLDLAEWITTPPIEEPGGATPGAPGAISDIRQDQLEARIAALEARRRHDGGKPE